MFTTTQMRKLLPILALSLLNVGCAVTPFEKEYYTEFFQRGAYGWDIGVKCGNELITKDKYAEWKQRFEDWKETGIVSHCIGRNLHASRGSYSSLTEADKMEMDCILATGKSCAMID